jgi:hypothetical protein
MTVSHGCRTATTSTSIRTTRITCAGFHEEAGAANDRRRRVLVPAHSERHEVR